MTTVRARPAVRGRAIKPLSLLSIAVFLLTWEVASHFVAGRVMNPNITLPSIEYVVTNSVPSFAVFTSGRVKEESYGLEDWVGGIQVLADSSAHTIARVLGGTLVGVLLGIGIGLALYYSPILGRLLETPINMIRGIPILALMPLFLLWFGNAEFGAFIYVVFGTSVMIVVNTLNAVRNIPPTYLAFARTLGARRGQVLRHVVIPSMVPELTGAIRVIIGVSWMITIAAELIAEQHGLGLLLNISLRHLNTGRMIIIVVVLGIYSVVVNKLYVKVADRLTRWQASKGASA